MTRIRAGVIIIQDDQVALIQRVNARGTYYIFPGGGVEDGETVEQAAVREAWEELGVQVHITTLFAVVEFDDSEQHYYGAHIVGGAFGSGIGAELSSQADTPAGTYTPMWLPLARLHEYNIRPTELSEAIQANTMAECSAPLRIQEMPP